MKLVVTACMILVSLKSFADHRMNLPSAYQSRTTIELDHKVPETYFRARILVADSQCIIGYGLKTKSVGNFMTGIHEEVEYLMKFRSKDNSKVYTIISSAEKSGGGFGLLEVIQNSLGPCAGYGEIKPNLN